MKQAKEYALNYLKPIRLMQLATCRDNMPWLCNVWFVMDDDMNVYWISRPSRRHSEDIAKNPVATATFHHWFDEGLGNQPGQALTLSGQVTVLGTEDIPKAHALYAKTFPNLLSFQPLEAFLNGTNHHAVYKLTPSEITWFDEVNFPKNPKQKIA